jgi:hypothetical protein
MNDNEMKLPGREAIEAYISDAGYICLKQENSLGDEPSVIVMFKNDIPTVVRWLQALAEQMKEQED